MTISNSPLVSKAVADAKDLPGLVANLQALDPALAQQITGKALFASKSVYGTFLVTLITWLVAKYGLGWSDGFVNLLAGGALLIGSAVFRKISTVPITSWFVSRSTAPVATPSSSGSSLAGIVIALFLAGSLMTACAPHTTTGPVLSAADMSATTLGKASVAATAAAPTLVDVAAAINPKAAAAVNAACPYAQGVLAIASACVSGGAAGPNGAVAQLSNLAASSCTEAGKLKLVANDTAAAATGPTASNSGSSAAWLQSLVANAAAIAPIGCPFVKAFIH